MKKKLLLAVLSAALLFTPPGTAPFIAHADTPVAVVEQLKTEALQAVRGGEFARTSELMSKAASMSNDPRLRQMAMWVEQFEVQRQVFVAERREQFDKAVADIRTLLEHGKEAYAIDAVARAYGLAEDKKAFRSEPWIAELITRTIQMARDAEDGHDWVAAMRLYSDLAAVEPTNPAWKEHLKGATRRVRLLALYVPEELRHYQEAQSVEREEVDRLIRPGKQPTTRPKFEENEAFKTDWSDTLRGIQVDMLWDALQDIHDEYYRVVEYKTLLLGGLHGLEALATTEGLEKTFPSLRDESKKNAFLAALAGFHQDADGATAQTEQLVLRNTLAKLKVANARSLNLPEEVLVSEFADGAFGELDPFSGMIWPGDLPDFIRRMQGEFSGVGIQIQSDDNMNLKVVSPLEDSPAYQAGIKAGDIVTAINGKNARGISLNEAVKQITGPEGTTVTLTIQSPDGSIKEHQIRRETIKVASVKGWEHNPGGGWDYFIDPRQKIGYVRITDFTKTTGTEFNNAVDQMQALGARGIIMDLRYNPGGLMVAATEVCDRLLSDGVIVSTRADRPTPNPPSITTARPSKEDITLPMVVLVNQYSASASEIVSGALKDRNRALIVGERTFGKGSVQMLFPLSTRSAVVKLTTSHYYLPSGRCIHRDEDSLEWGVDPDVTVEMTPEQMRAAIDARQELDILRNAEVSTPTGSRREEMKDAAPEIADAVAEVTGKDPLSSDAQLSTALLLMRLQLATGSPL